jgi:hypothetical protein
MGSDWVAVRVVLDWKLASVGSAFVQQLAGDSTYYSGGTETKGGVLVPCRCSSDCILAAGSTLRVLLWEQPYH